MQIGEARNLYNSKVLGRYRIPALKDFAEPDCSPGEADVGPAHHNDVKYEWMQAVDIVSADSEKGP